MTEDGTGPASATEVDDFVHLHVHSCFTFFDSTMQPEDIVGAARRAGARAIALTDTNCMAGAVLFAKAAMEAGIRPILGAEITEPLAREREVIRARAALKEIGGRPFPDRNDGEERGRAARAFDAGRAEDGVDDGESPSVSPALMHGNPSRRAVALARNFRGYSAISRLCTARHVEPDFSLTDELAVAGPDVIVMSDCVEVLKSLAASPVAGQCFAMLMPSRRKRRRNRAVYEWARAAGMPLVVCCDAKIAEPAEEERALHLLLQAMRRQMTVEQIPGHERLDPAQHLQAGSAVRRFFRLDRSREEPGDDGLFGAISEAIANTRLIAEQCDCVLPLGEWKLPHFDDLGADPAADLRGLVDDGLRRRYGNPPPHDALERATRELGVIHQLGFDAYFLLVHRIVDEARSRGFFTLGRGSAANSIVTYVLGISNVCPIRHKLHFERFLNPERSVPPDIDIDFSWKERDDILDWCFEYFGAERVALICTFQTLRRRQAVREAAKALGLCEGEISAFNRLAETGFRFEEGTFDDSGSPRVHDLSLAEPWQTVLAHAERLAGFPRHFSVHCGGILITPGPVTDWVPLTSSAKGYLITQIDMHGVEDLGLIKIDLLGNRSLAVLKDAVNLAERNESMEQHETVPMVPEKQVTTGGFDASTFRREAVRMKLAGTRRGTSVALAGVLETFAGDAPRADEPRAEGLPLRDCVQDLAAVTADAGTRELIHAGRTMGVFYVESPGMRALFERLRCGNFDEVVAASSIIRPGVSESGMMAEYVARHQESHRRHPVRAGRRDRIDIHPVMLRLLPDTHGVMVYQEDVLQVAHELAGMTYAEADLLRRAMSGKMRSSEAMARVRDRFIGGAVERGLPRPDAEEVWRQVSSFSGYSFCKGHSAAFAALSYQVAYLKVRHPAEFFAALLSNEGGFYGAGAYVEEARRWGLRVLGPCVNESGAEWSGRTERRVDVFRAEGWLRAGLRAVVGLSLDGRERILRERARHGPYRSVEDLARRLATGARPTLEEFRKLILAGAVDGLSPDVGAAFPSRRRLFLQFECAWRRRRLDGDGLLADWTADAAPAAGERAAGGAGSAGENSLLEMEHLGFMVSGHPLDFVAMPRVRGGIVPGRDIRAYAGKKVFMVGWVIAAKLLGTRNGRGMMMMLTMEDRTDTFETVLFPRVYSRLSLRTLSRGPFLIEGRVDIALGSPTVNVSDLRVLGPSVSS